MFRLAIGATPRKLPLGVGVSQGLGALVFPSASKSTRLMSSLAFSHSHRRLLRSGISMAAFASRRAAWTDAPSGGYFQHPPAKFSKRVAERFFLPRRRL